MTLSTSAGRVLLLQRLVALAGEPRNCFLAAERWQCDDARPLALFGALASPSLGSRFNRFAACAGAPSHWLTQGSGQA